MSLLDQSISYKPLKYEIAERHRVLSENMHWVPKEVNLVKDVEDYKKASKEEKDYIYNILSIFTQSDVNVADNYMSIISRISNNEFIGMLISFTAREYIHQEAYSLLTETLGFPDNYSTDFLLHKETAEKNKFMNELPSPYLGLILAKGILMEGISLFGSFVMLMHLNRQGKYSGMGSIVEWSIKDESLHVSGNAALFKIWCEENPSLIDNDFKKKIYSDVRKIVELEEDFIDFAFGTYRPEGLDKEDVKKYIKYISDRRLLQLGLKPNFGIKDNPLPWMDEVTNDSSIANFFEAVNTGYSKGNLKGEYEF